MSARERALTEIWYGKSSAASWLQPLASIYGTFAAARRALYAARMLPAYSVGRPVVVIGNLTVGGTGKTPLVAWLAQKLGERGLSVGILSRGYGRASDGTRLVEPASDWREVGDEPLLLRQRTQCHVVVSRDRLAGARALIERRVDVILADDGLQHLRLARDCEIIVIDGARGFGNGRLLPAGPLRDPVSELPRAEVIVLNGAPSHASLAPVASLLEQRAVQMTLMPGNVIPMDGRRTALTLDDFRGQRVHAVAGIGNPARFFADLRGRGLDVVEHAFGDHHPFSAGDLAFGDSGPILMTEKDAVKCRAFANARMWYVPVTARFSDAHALQVVERVIHKLGFAVSARG
jgi:tetraacyldisaccharide 4'-kinase